MPFIQRMVCEEVCKVTKSEAADCDSVYMRTNAE